MSAGNQVIVSGGFDDIRSRQLRFLQEAGKLGPVTVLLWPDEMLHKLTGKAPKFPLAERLYFLNSVRFVSRVIPASGTTNPDTLPALENMQPAIWADDELTATPARQKFCEQAGLAYRVFNAGALSGFPELPPLPSPAGRKKVLVTGCYDWLHSGHVRFFEEISAYGDLYVVAGHDANIRLLKGTGRPLQPDVERRYQCSTIKFVKQALVSSGDGWLDAAPEIERLKPDIYAVNEDGDKGGKREFCEKHGIEYLVLKRAPAPGLPPRSSTNLRGF